MALNVLLSVSLLLALCYARSNPPSYCLPIQPITQDIQIQPQPEVMTQQGRPGRIGPIGPIGPRGLQGSPGTPGSCACEASETEQLRMEMQRMRGIITDLFRAVRNLDSETLCGAGIKDGRIPDSAMTASSAWNSYEAYYGRLDNTGEQRGYWHPAGGQYDNQWLQVDFGSPTRIVGVITQGRQTADNWVTSYKVLYGNSTSNLVSIQSREGSIQDLVFQGNRDRNSKVANMFPQPITARYFRLVVVTYNGVPVFRIEYLTC